MEDRQIVDLYFARSDQAAAETEAKYGAYCRARADDPVSAKSIQKVKNATV